MDPNPVVGIALHALGGLGAASFYVPLKGIRNWRWESYWMLCNVVFLLVCPTVVAVFTVPRLAEVFATVESRAMVTALVLGACWGVGNLCFGLTIRFLGMSLAFGLALGFCTVFGTLGPPIIKGLLPTILPNLANQKSLAVLTTQASGQATILGLCVCILGIGFCGWAGMRKEAELSETQKQETVREFHFFKGLASALFCGVMSSFVNIAITDTEPLAVRSAELGTPGLWINSASMAIFLAGGAISNLLWCVLLNVRHGSATDYVDTANGSLLRNYALCGIAGVILYSEFFFYGIAAPNMGRFSFINLPIHLALVIVLGNVWAVVFREWSGTTRTTKALITIGTLVLVLSTVFMGWGGYLEQRESVRAPEQSMVPSAP